MLTNEAERLDLKGQVDQVIDQVKAMLTLESLAMPFGVVMASGTNPAAAGNQREVARIVERYLDLNYANMSQDKTTRVVALLHARHPTLQADKLQSPTDLEWTAFTQLISSIASEVGLAPATTLTNYSQAMAAGDDALASSQNRADPQMPLEASGGLVAETGSTSDRDDDHKVEPSSVGETNSARFQNSVDSLEVQLEVSSSAEPKDAWVLKRGMGGVASLRVPFGTLESQLFSRTVRQNSADLGGGPATGSTVAHHNGPT